MDAVVNAGEGYLSHELVGISPAAWLTWGGRAVRRQGGDAVPARAALSTVPIVADTMQCAHGYSGCIGVSIKGNHAASRSVASFPSLSPLRMAVTGRQKL